MTRSALRAAVASCAVGELEFWTDYEVLLHGTPELSTFPEGEYFHGASAMASRRFSATDIRESALLVVSGLVFRCDCRNSPQQLPLPALFLRLWVCRAARTRLGSRGRRGEERSGEGEKRRTADSTESVATVQYSTYKQTYRHLTRPQTCRLLFALRRCNCLSALLC